MLKKDPLQRLGSKGGAKEIKAHRFFRKIDWKKLERKELKPPIVPGTRTLEENFSETFRNMPPVESPVEGTPLSASLEALFKGFSYVDVSLSGLHEP